MNFTCPGHNTAEGGGVSGRRAECRAGRPGGLLWRRAHLFIRPAYQLVLLSDGAAQLLDGRHVLYSWLAPLETVRHGTQLF